MRKWKVILYQVRIDRKKLASGCAMMYGGVVILAALTRSALGLGEVLVLGGAVLTMVTTLINSILQAMAHDKIRGQTASLFMLAMRGGLSFGNLLTGVSVNFFGVRIALVTNGLMAIAVHAFLYRTWATQDAGDAGQGLAWAHGQNER